MNDAAEVIKDLNIFGDKKFTYKSLIKTIAKIKNSFNNPKATKNSNLNI